MPTQVDTQTQEGGTGTVTHQRGSEDEAIALFNQRAQSKAEPVEETPTDDAETDQAEETQEGDPETEDEATDNAVEVEYEGKQYKLPPELKDAVLRKADYSRHIQEVTKLEKDYAQRIEHADKLAEGAQEYAKVLATVQALEAQIDQFKDVDFDKLEAEDPARASVLAVRLLRLQQAREKAVGETKEVASKLEKGKAEALAAAQTDMAKVLDKDLPGWRGDLGGKISEYALTQGFTEKELRTLSDPKVVIALDKARKFDAIQKGKAETLGKVEKVTQQVLKPGQRRTVSAEAEAMQRLQKSRSPDDAVALLMARAAQRRK